MLLDYDVALEDDFQQLLAHLPAPVRDLLTAVDTDAHHERQAVYTLFGAGSPTSELTQAVECLALATNLNRASFTLKPTLNDLAISKAQAYASQYLSQHFNQLVVHATGLADTMKQDLFTAATELPLANLNRLRLNFNQRERIADFLKDTKDRSARLTGLSAELAASLADTDAAVSGLARAIGETIGIIAKIHHDVQDTRQIADFHERLLRGDYPLPLLFGFENEAGYFYDFFHQTHQPTADQFVAAQQKVLATGLEPALTMANELVDQARLDCQQLPAGDTRQRVERALERLTATNSEA
ncbi:hypothetical protein [Lactiplantibacillus pentosus]